MGYPKKLKVVKGNKKIGVWTRDVYQVLSVEPFENGAKLSLSKLQGQAGSAKSLTLWVRFMKSLDKDEFNASKGDGINKVKFQVIKRVDESLSTLIQDLKETALSPLAKKILAKLKKTGAAHTVHSLAEPLSASEKQVSAAVAELSKAGKVAQDKRTKAWYLDEVLEEARAPFKVGDEVEFELERMVILSRAQPPASKTSKKKFTIQRELGDYGWAVRPVKKKKKVRGWRVSKDFEFLTSFTKPPLKYEILNIRVLKRA